MDAAVTKANINVAAATAIPEIAVTRSALICGDMATREAMIVNTITTNHQMVNLENFTLGISWCPTVGLSFARSRTNRSASTEARVQRVCADMTLLWFDHESP
jgi:hypothetical protein